MSLLYTQLAWQVQGLRADEKLALLALAECAGECGYLSCSVARIAHMTGLDDGSCRRAMKRLQRLGLLLPVLKAGHMRLDEEALRDVPADKTARQPEPQP